VCPVNQEVAESLSKGAGGDRSCDAPKLCRGTEGEPPALDGGNDGDWGGASEEKGEGIYLSEITVPSLGEGGTFRKERK